MGDNLGQNKDFEVNFYR